MKRKHSYLQERSWHSKSKTLVSFQNLMPSSQIFRLHGVLLCQIILSSRHAEKVQTFPQTHGLINQRGGAQNIGCGTWLCRKIFSSNTSSHFLFTRHRHTSSINTQRTDLLKKSSLISSIQIRNRSTKSNSGYLLKDKK